MLSLAPHLAFLRGEEWFEEMRERARRRAETQLALVQAARDRGELSSYLEPTLDEVLADLALASEK